MSGDSTKPDFLIIGAVKSATTALSNLLRLHPQAAIVKGKEPHFFSIDKNYNMGWSYYQSLYSHCTDELAMGDASTSYSRIRYHPQTVQRILKHVPDVKIIYMVRHPVERMVSAYVERLATVSADHVYQSINQAVKKQPMIIDSSRYWEVFNHYRQHFDESRIKIVWFEEFVRDNTAVFKDVCRFLEIDDGWDITIGKEKQNTREGALQRMKNLGRRDMRIKTEWNKNTLKWVVTQIRDDNLRFLEYFQKPGDYWGDLFG